jgi:hypothetical protein
MQKFEIDKGSLWVSRAARDINGITAFPLAAKKAFPSPSPTRILLANQGEHP